MPKKSLDAALLRDYNGNKAYNLLFLCNPYHAINFRQLKILLVTLLFFIVDYIFLKQFVKLLMVKCTYILTGNITVSFN